MEIRKEVMLHITKLFNDIEGVTKLFPDDLWKREGISDMMMVPAFLAHHTIWCMSYGHLLNIPKEKMPNEPYIPRYEKWPWKPDYQREYLPSRLQLLALLNDIRDYVSSFYGEMENEVFLNDDSEKDNILGRIIYTLAHTRHHLGQLVQILKENDIEPQLWYSTAKASEKA